MPKGYLMDTWRSWAAQGMAGTYIVATTVWTSLDQIVKFLIGVAMLVLVIHQVVVLNRRIRKMHSLESLVARAVSHCEKAKQGGCWLQDELDREQNKGSKAE